jgi:hypothetical protein
MEVVDQEYLRLSYRPDLHLLFLRWTRAVSSQEHRAGYAAALELAQAEQCGRWLVDLRVRGLASAEDFAWVLEKFRPQLRTALPVPRRLAYLVTPYQAELLNSRLHEHEPLAADAAREGAEVRNFIEELPAQHWLQLGT